METLSKKRGPAAMNPSLLPDPKHLILRQHNNNSMVPPMCFKNENVNKLSLINVARVRREQQKTQVLNPNQNIVMLIDKKVKRSFL
jgi:hypothetical protein